MGVPTPRGSCAGVAGVGTEVTGVDDPRTGRADMNEDAGDPDVASVVPRAWSGHTDPDKAPAGAATDPDTTAGAATGANMGTSGRNSVGVDDSAGEETARS